MRVWLCAAIFTLSGCPELDRRPLGALSAADGGADAALEPAADDGVDATVSREVGEASTFGAVAEAGADADDGATRRDGSPSRPELDDEDDEVEGGESESEESDSEESDEDESEDGSSDDPLRPRSAPSGEDDDS